MEFFDDFQLWHAYQSGLNYPPNFRQISGVIFPEHFVSAILLTAKWDSM